MNLTRDNYEQYFLDYYEGSLDDSQVRVLMLFLEEHPDLKQEFEDFSMITLEQDPGIGFFNKGTLKKEEIGQGNADRFFAAYVEGDLTPGQQAETESFVAAHPEKARDLELMKHTVLEPDLSIRFPHKSSLKRHTINPMMRKLWYATSVAATVLIMAGLFFNWNPEIPTQSIVIPVPQEVEVPAEAEPLPDATPEAAVETPAPKAPAATPPARPAATPATSTPREMPEPLNTGRLSGKSTAPLPTNDVRPSENMEQRTEFAYWSSAVAQQQRSARAPERQGRASALTTLALNRLERTLPSNVKNVREKIASGNRISLWDVAGMGLAGLSNLTGAPLNLQQQRDEQGNIIQLAVGKTFEYEKK